jgi:hypothetical protein
MKLALAALALALAAAVVGCGGSDSNAADTVAKEPPLYPWLKGPSREFLIRGGDNLIQTYGREGTPAEREEASRVVHSWMLARARQDWKKDCSYFSHVYSKTLTADAHRVTHGRVKSCPQALAYFKHEASGSYRNNLEGPIVSLRVEGRGGYAQYHGNDGHDWIVPMTKEDGHWWVSTATPIGRSS